MGVWFHENTPTIIAVLFYLRRIPPTSLLPGVRYDLVAKGLGGRGRSVSTPDELKAVLDTVLSEKDRKLPYLINVEISPYSSRRPQVYTTYFTCSTL